MSQPTAHHVGLTVTDLDRSVDFYERVFDLSVLDRFTVGGAAFATGVDVPGATGSFAHLDGGDVRIELIEYDPQGQPVDAQSLNQPGACHLGLDVADLEAFDASLPDDVETLSEPQTTESGTSILFVRDPDDNLIEILELGD